MLTGLLELVERDAFMLVWHNRLSLPLLDWSGDAALVRIDRRYFDCAGLRYAAVDLSASSTCRPCSASCTGDRASSAPSVSARPRAPTVEIAWRKALAEAFSVQRWVRDMAYEEPERLGGDGRTTIRTFDAHTLYYATEERACAGRVPRRLTGQRRPTGDVAPSRGRQRARAGSRQSAGRLAARGVSAYAVDVTSPDVAARRACASPAWSRPSCARSTSSRERASSGGRRMYEAAFEAGLVRVRSRPPI